MHRADVQRIVHFDLKGAPPKIPFFEQVLQCITIWGGTGVLLEWEDTFPYSAELTQLGSESNSGGDGLYSILDVHHIIKICNQLGLEVIQLVQTIGHMEFVLKHPRYMHLRENDRSPAIICPAKQESRELVRKMVVQTLAAQPSARYFHIGGDEVCHIGVCSDCSKKVTSEDPQALSRIYLDYIRDLVLFIKELQPKIKILMWDDMLRAVSPEVLGGYPELFESVELVVWNYNVKEEFRFPPGMWDMYQKYFPVVWAGSAFKGANGSSQLISPVSRYVRNQEAWMNEIRATCCQLKYNGVIFTGWSRYDHFATLCELLPASMNSLANCLKSSMVHRLEDCPELLHDNTLQSVMWPGLALAQSVRNVAIIHEGYSRISGDFRMTWLNSWQVKNGFLNFFQVDFIENYMNSLIMELQNQKNIATHELNVIFGPRTTAEWIQTYIGNMEKGFADLQQTIREARRFDHRSPLYVTPMVGGVSTVVKNVRPVVEDGTARVEEVPPMVE